ncbi:MAG: RNA 2'-phosphotransferase [Candidatus Omnitrophica bacterium]|nr:RNA 2'-phosphotransferase [Candidatus Omnitrophota bacterium]MCB9719313.1 RNA 2'-phosphotransferase [Candidatus Omnitrophota bacterium]
MSERLTAISKYLSFVLRHKPQAIGLKLDANGWARVDELITCAARDGRKLTPELIAAVVATDPKQRYAFSEDGARIRANQGHSVDVDLQLKEEEPPAVLFHGTARASLEAILVHGLKPMQRHHVHLSVDESTAYAVGRRYGEPVILRVDCAAMRADGHVFFRSENGVWLTDTVPAKFLAIAGDRTGS